MNHRQQLKNSRKLTFTYMLQEYLCNPLEHYVAKKTLCIFPDLNVKAKLSLCLTKYNAMKTYPLLN